jgi:glycogen debranching enzyme
MMLRTSTILLCGMIPLLHAVQLAAQAPRTVPRFDLGTNALALSGVARPGTYVGDQGRRAAVFGDEAGNFEVWTWPVKLVRDLNLAFKIPEYDDPIPASTVARHVVVRPEGVTLVYSHATFTVEQHVFVPMNEPGAVMLLEVQTVRPLDVLVRMHADFNLAWPGSFGGGNISWQPEQTRFLLTQGGVRLYNAFIGSPYATSGTSHPAHDAPLVGSQFTLRFDTARASAEYIPIVAAGGAMVRDSAERVYTRLLGNAERYWREKVEHYRGVHGDLLSMRSPDAALDLALEWAKINLDQQLVCNPDLGCGLVAGFGRAGAGNFRPGFGWFFGGDASINSFAMDGLGQFALVRQGLEFFAKYQRADGKITHEISQAAARLPWFTDYPYTFFHGDTTPFWILACYRYWLASGDDAFLRAMWPHIVKAFRWSAATDGNGDGLMENPLAGAGAIEVGGLGENLLTDIYLGGVWLASLEGLGTMATAMRDGAVGRDAAALLARARATLESAFWLDGPGIYAFALLQGGEANAGVSGSRAGQARTNDALTVWPATAMSFGLLDAARAGRMLREIGSSRLTADWGTRMLASDHRLYEPLHYNNGTVWGFVTGFAAMAHYRYHRAWAGFDLVRDVARTTFDFARGRNPELMSGAFYRQLDTAVPQQFFATSMLVSPLVQGLLGLSADAPRRRVTLSPHLPAEWDSLSVSGFRVGEAVLNVRMRRTAGGMTIRIARMGGPAEPLVVTAAPALPLGARVTAVRANGGMLQPRLEQTPHDTHAAVEVNLSDSVTVTWTYDGGAELLAPEEPLEVGQPSTSLRILDFRREGTTFVVQLEGLAGREYAVGVRSARAPASVQGAAPAVRSGAIWTLPVTIAGGGVGYHRHEVRFTLSP